MGNMSCVLILHFILPKLLTFLPSNENKKSSRTHRNTMCLLQASLLKVL